MAEGQAPNIIPPTPEADTLPPKNLALSCIRHLRATCRRYHSVLNKVHTDYYLCPEPKPPSLGDLKWLAKAQLRLWDITISTLLFSSSSQLNKCAGFIKVLGRARALQTLFQRLLCGPPEMEDGTAVWTVEDPARTWTQVCDELPGTNEEHRWWVESAAVVYVREEYKQKIRILKERLERERAAHVKTKRQALKGEIKYLEALAEKYREIAALRERYEYDREFAKTEEQTTDDESLSLEESNPENTATLGLGLPRGTKRNLEGEETTVDTPTNEPSTPSPQPHPYWGHFPVPTMQETIIIVDFEF